MIKTLTLLILFFLSGTTLVFGQDTTIYIQANASLFSNTYTFIKKNKSDKSGTFIQLIGSDDGQCWYGQGTFKETKRKIHLTFDTSDHVSRVEFVANGLDTNWLYICCYDWWGEPQIMFNVRYTDTTLVNSIYHSDWEKGFVKIPKATLKNTNLTVYANSSSSRKLVDFEVSNGVQQVNIYASDCLPTDTVENREVVLKKTRNGFITVGMWTGGKKTKFVLRRN